MQFFFGKNAGLVLNMLKIKKYIFKAATKIYYFSIEVFLKKIIYIYFHCS